MTVSEKIFETLLNAGLMMVSHKVIPIFLRNLKIGMVY